MWLEMAVQWSPAVVPVVTGALALIHGVRRARRRRNVDSDPDPAEVLDHDRDIATILVEGLQADLAKCDRERDEYRHEAETLRMKVYMLEARLAASAGSSAPP